MTNTPTCSTSGFLAPGIYLDEIDPGTPDIPAVTRERVRALLEHICEAELTGFVYEENSAEIRAQLSAALRVNLVTCWARDLLKGRSAQEAFFLRWDYTTTMETDFDNWFLICTVGMAPVNPSEFVAFRILIRFASKLSPLAKVGEAF